MAKLYIKKSDGTYVPQKLQSVTNIDIVQEKGDSQNKVMSQKAVTDAMNASDEKLSELGQKVKEKETKCLVSSVRNSPNYSTIHSIKSYLQDYS